MAFNTLIFMTWFGIDMHDVSFYSQNELLFKSQNMSISVSFKSQVCEISEVGEVDKVGEVVEIGEVCQVGEVGKVGEVGEVCGVGEVCEVRQSSKLVKVSATGLKELSELFS